MGDRGYPSRQVRITRVSGRGDDILAVAVIGGQIGVAINVDRASGLSDHAAAAHACRHVEEGDRVFVCGAACPVWRS